MEEANVQPVKAPVTVSKMIQQEITKHVLYLNPHRQAINISSLLIYFLFLPRWPISHTSWHFNIYFCVCRSVEISMDSSTTCWSCSRTGGKFPPPTIYSWWGVFAVLMLNVIFYLTSLLFIFYLCLCLGGQGDFVDRGHNSVETLQLLLCLKAR